tara:strand:- start:57 stop:539 length:483 start_codon:yes stop_codon:yes gene_type:complete
MNKDIDDPQVLAQKIAQEQDAGLTQDQTKLVKHIEQAIKSHKSGTCTTEAMKKDREELSWHEKYNTEHKLRLEAEGETHLVKAVGMNSPEMKEAKAKAKELEDRLAEALMLEDAHQKLNGKLQVRLTELEQENIELRADNKKLAAQVDDKVNQLRNKGVI